MSKGEQDVLRSYRGKFPRAPHGDRWAFCRHWTDFGLRWVLTRPGVDGRVYWQRLNVDPSMPRYLVARLLRRARATLRDRANGITPEMRQAAAMQAARDELAGNRRS